MFSSGYTKLDSSLFGYIEFHQVVVVEGEMTTCVKPFFIFSFNGVIAVSSCRGGATQSTGVETGRLIVDECTVTTYLSSGLSYTEPILVRDN